MISVIIPTYNDAKILRKTLDAVVNQDYDDVFELIVIDDGSTDNTSKILSEYKKGLLDSKKISFSFYKQKNKKQGAARNHGVRVSKGDILLFIGSDIILSNHCLRIFHDFHNRHPEEKYMAIGPTPFPPNLMNDRFRRFLVSTGMMNNYEGLKDFQETDYWHFYTGNISMKKSFFTKFWFNEDFKHYGWEDTQMGYEMISSGAKLYYLDKAIAYHYHELTESDLFPGRMIEIGKSALVFAKNHPSAGVVPKGIKLFIFRIISLSFIRKLLHMIRKEWGWYADMKHYFLIGLGAK